MSRPLKIVSVMIALLLLVEPAFANPIMVNPFQVINPSLANLTICTPKTPLRENIAAGDVGQVLTATNPAGTITQYSYNDSTGYLTSLTSDFGDSTHLNVTTQFVYDNRGNVLSVTDTKNNTTTFSYDVLNRLTQTTSCAPFNYVTKFSYDPNGNLTELDKQASSDGTQWQTTQYSYDSLDHLIQTKQSLDGSTMLTTSFEYDANGNRSKVTDANGKVTQYTYNERNLLASVIDAKNAITAYVYDPNGNLQTITDANNNGTTYSYDGFDRLSKTTYVDSTYEGYAYDANSNLLSKRTRGGSVINYTYDNLNRLTTKTYPDTTSVAYSYDVASRLTSVTGGGVTNSYSYDSLNRVIQTAAAGKTISYEYDALGNRTKLTYPDSSYITYQYDALNRLTGIQDQGGATIAGYGYDTLSRRINVNLANNTQTNYQYDNVNRLVSMANKINGGADISTFGYAYDSVGNRLSKTTAAGQETYGYDNLNQLTSVQYPAAAFPNTGFNYDPLGNRTTMTNGAATTYGTNNLNQYTQVNSNALGYDNNGNLTTQNGWTYGYDYENRLTSATNGTTNASYGYDPLGRRISKTVGGVTTNFVYDGDNLLAEYDSSGTLLRKYIHSDNIDEPIAMVSGSNTYYYNSDGLGSISELTDSSGAVAEKYQYDVYGKTIIKDLSDNVLTASAIGNRFAFTGRESDSETGLYFYRARVYSPDLGRFLQTDPIGYYGGINLYAYVKNSATNFIDPFGFCKDKPWWQNLGTAITGNLEAAEIPANQRISPSDKALYRVRVGGVSVGFGAYFEKGYMTLLNDQIKKAYLYEYIAFGGGWVAGVSAQPEVGLAYGSTNPESWAGWGKSVNIEGMPGYAGTGGQISWSYDNDNTLYSSGVHAGVPGVSAVYTATYTSYLGEVDYSHK